MKKRLVALLTAVCLSITPVVVFAEDTDTDTSTTDVLDNSAELKEVEENGIPTEEIVTELKANADALYEKGDYEKAGEAYYETARKANYLANIMRQCIEPYYSSRNDYPNTPDAIWDDLIVFESKSNEMIGIRDICYVYQGICYNKTGDTESALAVLYRALDLITDREEEAWVLATKELMNIIQYEAIGTKYVDLKNEAENYVGKTIEEFKEHFGEPEGTGSVPETGSTWYDYEGFTVWTKGTGSNETVNRIS